MLLFSFIVVIVCDLFQWKGICIGVLLFISNIVGDPIANKGRVGISLTALTSPHVCVYPNF
jgi:hypothetical protein